MAKIKSFISIVLIICLAVIFNCQSPSSGSGSNTSGYSWSSTDDYAYYLFSNNEYKLNNNVWGKGNIANYSQVVFFNNKNDFGWEWDWPNIPSSSYIKAFPEVAYGLNIWDGNPSTTKKLPALVSDSNFIIDVSVEQKITGKYNTSFFIYIIDSPTPTYANIKAELMIWLNYENFNVDNNDAVIDGESYKLNYNPNTTDQLGMAHWKYCAYLRQNMTTSASLNLSSFLNDMINRGYIQSNWYISNIEFGNEVVYGTGKTTVTHYEITKQ